MCIRDNTVQPTWHELYWLKASNTCWQRKLSKYLLILLIKGYGKNKKIYTLQISKFPLILRQDDRMSGLFVSWLIDHRHILYKMNCSDFCTFFFLDRFETLVGKDDLFWSCWNLEITICVVWHTYPVYLLTTCSYILYV